MASPYGIKLAVYLVSTHFGDLNSKVCECLLRRGTLTLAHIMRFTELSRENVRRSLLVLIHQNCVQAFALEQKDDFGDTIRMTTHYTALFDNIIHRLRFPKFREIVSQELGEECVGLFEGLLQHGRLSINQIIDRHKQTSNQGNFDKGTIRESFSKLVNARFVERCPAPEPLITLSANEGASARKKAAKSAKVGDKSQTLEHRALVAAAPLESLRFLVEMDGSSDASDKNSDEHSISSTSGEKRKRKLDSIESDGGLMGQDEKKDVLWRANFEEFVRRLRNKICIANVTSSLDSQASIVLNAVLELIGRSEAEVASGSTDSLSVNDIYDEVIKNEAGLGMDLESTNSTLSQLESQMLVTWTDGGTYSVDMKNIIRLAQNGEVESIVFKKFGREAYRIFRALSKAGRLLETDKIADQTFVEKKDAIKILYTLWKGEYIQMEKVTTSNGGRLTQFSLWKVNEQSLQKHVLDEMYHAALNLRLRIAYEVDQQTELLRLPKENLTGEKAKDFKRLVQLQIILESSVMDLDDDLMLFNDF